MGLCASLSAVSLLSVLILPPGIIACLILLLTGLYISISAADQLLLSHGVRKYIPDWLHIFLAERDLFELWVDFLRENNPIMIFLRLTALKVFDLNREEAVVLMGGVGTPWMRKLRRRTVISLLPGSLITRYAPDLKPPVVLHPSITNLVQDPSSRVLPTVDDDSSAESDRQQTHSRSSANTAPLFRKTSKQASLSAVLAEILEARFRPALVKAGPRVRRVAIKVALVFFVYSVISRTKRWRMIRARINCSATFWALTATYLLVLPFEAPGWLIPFVGRDERKNASSLSPFRRVIDVLQGHVTPSNRDAKYSQFSPISSTNSTSQTPRQITTPGSTLSCPTSPARVQWELDMCLVSIDPDTQ